MESLTQFQIAPDLQNPANRSACLRRLYHSATLEGLKDYLSMVDHALGSKDSQYFDEAIHVALPLVYRLGLDNSEAGYRIGAELKNKCARLAFPHFYSALQDEVDFLFRSYCRTSRQHANVYLNEIIKRLRVGAESFNTPFHVYGRVKSPYSIFEKLLSYATATKSTKVADLPKVTSVASVLSKFEANIQNRLADRKNFYGYSHEEIPWIFPDLVAVTVQFENTFIKGTNLGTAKRKYRSAFRRIAQTLASDVYFGPAFSDKWHMNRLVFYALFRAKDTIQIPTEVFIRTDYDYFIGYANYWRYKRVDLLEKAQTARMKTDLLRALRECRTFSEVQHLIFDQVTEGQLALF